MPRGDLFQPRRGTSAQWATADPVLAMGEPGLDTDTGVEKIGDGVTAWSGLPAVGGGGGLSLVVPDGTEYDDFLVTFLDESPTIDTVSLITANGVLDFTADVLTVVATGLYRFEAAAWTGTYAGDPYFFKYGIRVTFGSDYWAATADFVRSDPATANAFLDRHVWHNTGTVMPVLTAGQVLAYAFQSSLSDAALLGDLSGVTGLSATFRVTKIIGA